MSWYIDSSVNNGYPFNDEFPSSFVTDWTATDTIPLPAFSWRILENVNNGYPFTGVFPSEFRTDWFVSRDLPLPPAAWRIEEGVNNGYPTQGWVSWGDNAGSGGDNTGGGMVIGGSKTNYPGGFHSCNRGGILKQFDKKSMWISGNGSTHVRNAIHAALSGREFALNGSELRTILNTLNLKVQNPAFETKIQLINSLYGANVYDGILCCKVYPFNISLSSDSQQAPVMYGLINLGGDGNIYPAPSDTVQILDLGQITLDIDQAWEIESVDYSIYLPFCGIYPLDVRTGATIGVKAYVDLYHGVGEYHILQDNQWKANYKFTVGTDIPINLVQGITHSNMVSNVASVVSNGLPVVLGAAGGAIGGPMGASIGSMAGNVISGVMDKTYTMHNQVTAPQVGGLASLYCYPYARIIAKVPKMFKDANGYDTILGESRNACYDTLSHCSGFVQTKNYKCDIIVATDEEKAEIERLMDSGVFL